MRRFVILGTRALASGRFHLDDVAGSGGRMDVLLRATRAALLVSHGLRRDVIVYLVLLGGEDAPRVLRIEGALAKFIRPDERNLSALLQQCLLGQEAGPRFVSMHPGISLASGALETVFEDVGPHELYVLETHGADIRSAPIEAKEPVFVLGDDRGIPEDMRADLASRGAQSICIGPLCVHTDDAIAVLSNELDRLEK